MPAQRYPRTAGPRVEVPLGRTWPGTAIEHAPLWCPVDLRDGNQSLPNPMDVRRKTRMFDLMVRMGFKEIEVGYPSASEADFDFVRQLVIGDRIPDDVLMVVFTPARADLIERTFEAIDGAPRALVHLCMATSCLWREVVFGVSVTELHRLAVTSAGQIARLAAAAPRSQFRFQYSPETFNVTEPEVALTLADAVAEVWDACPDRPVTLNLPTTVETDTPDVFADQVAWMHRNLARRDGIILSVHPHNDRGTAVASAELALKAGADRVEGTLFGNGERTGNVCLATLALNLFSRGVDPQLDFSDIDGIRRTVEHCNQLPVHPRHPYVGDLVYTAFSGTHQDAIAKGLAAREQSAREVGEPEELACWEVPYLPIDPRDVGRTYESVVRVNSQSGKGGVAYVLKSRHGLDLPRDFRIEFATAVQRRADASGQELASDELWELFSGEYLQLRAAPLLKEYHVTDVGAALQVNVVLARADGVEVVVSGRGDSVAAAAVAGLRDQGWTVSLRRLEFQPDGDGTRPQVAYCELDLPGGVVRGVGIDDVADRAELEAVLGALGRGGG